MLLQLSFSGDVPVYQQIRDQVVSAIASGQIAPGEKLPAIRALAEDAGINMMTVNKAYQLLKTEGYITTGRRDGTIVRLPAGGVRPETKDGLRLRICELRLAGLGKDEILKLCGEIYDREVEGK